MDMIHDIEKGYMKKEFPFFNIGDTVDVECIIREGSKERRQIFSGVVMAMKGRGVRRTFTVRRNNAIGRPLNDDFRLPAPVI